MSAEGASAPYLLCQRSCLSPHGCGLAGRCLSFDPGAPWDAPLPPAGLPPSGASPPNPNLSPDESRVKELLLTLSQTYAELAGIHIRYGLPASSDYTRRAEHYKLRHDSFISYLGKDR